MRYSVTAFGIPVVLLILLLAAPVCSQISVRGDWLGKFPDVELRLLLSLDTTQEGYKGIWSSPNQGGMPLDIRSCMVTGDSVFIVFGGATAQFSGRIISGNTQELRGIFSMSGRSRDIVLRKAEKYDGVLDDAALHLPLVFKFAVDPEGQVLATMQSPDQSSNEIPAGNASLSGDHLHLEFTELGATYDGTISADHGQINGIFNQGTKKTLTLHRLMTMSLRNRPQEPHPPFPYRSEDVSFPNDGNRLSGTLTRPNGKGPFPVVLLIPGSGPNDRDETIFGHKPFLVIADHLTRHGMAVLRVDKRGVGSSTGSLKTATTFDFATDAEAAVAYLMTRPDIDHRRIGLIGHSEGGMIAPIVAARNSNVRFIVLLAGPGLRGYEIGKTQHRALALAAGVHDVKSSDLSDRINDIIIGTPAGKNVDSIIDETVHHYEDSLLAAIKADSAKKKQIDESMNKILATSKSPWTKEFIRYDPVPTLKKVICPVLALNGGLDAQVVPEENINAIAKALSEAKNRDVTTKIFPGLNHLFQHAKTGAFSEYAEIDETFSPEALDYLSTWVIAHSR